MREHNINWFLYELLKNDLGFLFERAIGTFDRSYCTEAGHIVGKPYGTVRDLNKIWKSDCLVKHMEVSGEKFDERNTILIDNEEISVIDQQENSLIINKFEEIDVKA